jgi:hypothetical protein
MTLVNIVIPEFLVLADELEAWDLASESLNSELWKNFYTSLMNVVFFLILNFGGTWLSQRDEVFITGVDPGDGIECKEDGLVDEWLKLLISEVVIRYAYNYLFSYLWVRGKSLLDETYDWKGEFELGDEVVWLLTLEFIFWCAQIIYPILTIVGAILLYLHCNFLIYRLRHMKRQPKQASNDKSTGSTFSKYLCITFMTVCLFYAAILFVPAPRNNFLNLRTSAAAEGEEG